MMHHSINTEKSSIHSVKIMQVVVVDESIGDGIDTPIRSFISIYDMNGNLIKTGDWTQNGSL